MLCLSVVLSQISTKDSARVDDVMLLLEDFSSAFLLVEEVSALSSQHILGVKIAMTNCFIDPTVSLVNAAGSW